MSKFSFPKSERICNKHDIDLLFEKAGSVRRENILVRFTFRESKGNEPLQLVLIVVPKKRVRLAVNRNRIKRQLREIYRLNKQVNIIETAHEKTLLIALIYVGQAKTDYIELEKNCVSALAKLKTEVSQNHD